MPAAGHCLPAHGGGILWRVARGISTGGGETGGSTGSPHWAGGEGGSQAHVGETGHAPPARQRSNPGKPSAIIPCPRD